MLGALTPSIELLRKTGKIKLSLDFSNSQMRQRALFNQVLEKLKENFLALMIELLSIIQKTI
jgi:hypothetical protein